MSRDAQRFVIGAHLVLTGYGHWLPNDLRGSGSIEVRKDELRDLGEVHHGRKRVQPSKSELREFFERAEPLLEHEVLWFDVAKRQALADGFRQVMHHYGYTCWSCAILRNHAHFVLRSHRDAFELIRDRLANASREAMLGAAGVAIPANHPVWSSRIYFLFIHEVAGVWTRIDYVNDNPEKEHLPRQHHDFVTPYDNWPLHKKKLGTFR